jgi:aldehyde:ferredoxin oxidoreductase
MGGYAGQILYVDLTSGSIEKKPLDMDFARKHIGGLGFGARIYLDLIKNQSPDFDPLSELNPFVLMTGPLTGMKMNGVARWTVCSKSPLTGFYGDSNTGGFFGAYLKFAGYDGIVITGKAASPSYLYINDDIVEIRKAEKYWGQDVYTVTDALKDDLKEGQKTGQVLAIGPAGENGVRFASLINNKGHAAGRTGMGAVWGSKRLKAIYVNGTGKINIAHPEALDALRAELKEVYADSIGIMALHSAGTATHMDVGIIGGDIPIKNWQQTEWDDIDAIGPSMIEEKIFAGHKTCFGCGVACKKSAEVKDGPFQMEKGPGPEYETIATFGTMCLNSSIESIAKANEICNRYGMDTITCGSTIAFAIDCFENGLITEKDTDGLSLTWGNSETIVKLTEKIGKQEGFGTILSMGSEKAAEKIGGNARDFLTTVKGLEAPMHDPRGAHGYGLAYGVSPRGACHEASLTFEAEGGLIFIPEIPELSSDLPEGSEDRAQLNVAAQDYGMFFSNCAVFCNLGASPLNATQAIDMVNHVTGFDYTLDEILKIGRQLWYLKRGLTNLFGARAKDDRLPARLMTVLETGPTEGSVPDMDRMLAEFYELRGFNADGVPEKQVLENIGLPELAGLLHP